MKGEREKKNTNTQTRTRTHTLNADTEQCAPLRRVHPFSPRPVELPGGRINGGAGCFIYQARVARGIVWIADVKIALCLSLKPFFFLPLLPQSSLPFSGADV